MGMAAGGNGEREAVQLTNGVSIVLLSEHSRSTAPREQIECIAGPLNVGGGADRADVLSEETAGRILHTNRVVRARHLMPCGC